MAAVARTLRDRVSFMGKALAFHAKQLTFASVSSVKYTYNPFCPNTNALRETAFQMSIPKRRVTNPGCTFQVVVKSDKCEPTMEVTFTNGHKALFKTYNLNTYEILQQFNNLCTVNEIKSNAPPPKQRTGKNVKRTKVVPKTA